MRETRKQTNGKKRRSPECQKALLISWACFLIIGALLGCGICALAGAGQAPEEQTSEAERDAETLPPYGTRDGRVMAGEMSMDWGGDYEDEFVVIACSLSEDLQEFTFYLCKGYYIDYSFAMAVMFRESSFNTGAVSADGHDHGLFQIRDVNNEWLEETIGVTDMNDPYQNIRAGLFMLRRLFEKYDDPARVLMAYNMGEYGASMLWEQGVYETTFTRRIFETADKYEAEIESSKK